MAMIYPELVAALGHIDSNWPGVRYGRVEVDYQTVEPMRIALEKQQERQIDMPVWYTYGTREASSPVCRGCSQQQRIILARALTQQTPCLILDEPTNHLDIKYQLQLMDIVKSLDLTVISAIHDLNIAAMYCDRLFVMKDGHIVGFGTPEEMLTQKRIKEIYEVDAEVIKDSQGHLHILYFPAHWAGASV